MSDAPQPDAATDSAKIAREAVPAILRVAPRYSRFIGTGVAVGAGLGLGVGLGIPGTGFDHRTVVTVLMMTGFAIVAAVIALAIAFVSEGRDPGPAQQEWLDTMIDEHATPEDTK